MPTADLPHLTSSSWRDNGRSNVSNSNGTGQEQGDEEHEALIDQTNSSNQRNHTSIRTSEYDGENDEERSTYDRSESLEGGRLDGDSASIRDSVDVDDVELPLRPGASVRFRPAAANRKWWQSTRPLSVMCAIFGSVVLVISGKFFRSILGPRCAHNEGYVSNLSSGVCLLLTVWTAISDTASGKTGAVHVC